ncbi:hypothetical protein HanRHA438_Chr01g0012521 [Helianthus annuus]|nr:hypothetical protein HanRHA438_Chr01g0012521 [Helianthus annuus]
MRPTELHEARFEALQQGILKASIFVYEQLCHKRCVHQKSVLLSAGARKILIRISKCWFYLNHSVDVNTHFHGRVDKVSPTPISQSLIEHFMHSRQ